jgi:hypothetical protein
VGRWDVVGCCDGYDIVMVGKSVKVERWDVVGCCDGWDIVIVGRV